MTFAKRREEYSGKTDIMKRENMTVISMSKALSRELKVTLIEDQNLQPDWHVFKFNCIGYDFIMVIGRGSYYSYLWDLREDEDPLTLLQEKVKGNHEYTSMPSASVRADLNSIMKKAKFLLERAEDEEKVISIINVMDLLNSTPWKFLNFQMPVELENNT